MGSYLKYRVRLLAHRDPHAKFLPFRGGANYNPDWKPISVGQEGWNPVRISLRSLPFHSTTHVFVRVLRVRVSVLGLGLGLEFGLGLGLGLVR
jgi:hypothetical protein